MVATSRQQHNQQHGFTLVELMVTVVVLGIVILGIAGLYYNMQVVEARSQHLDLATRAARTQIEVLRNSNYKALIPGDTINFTGNLPDALPPDAAGSATVSQPVDGLRRIDVTITYTDFGKQETIKLSSNIGVIGIGQGQ